VFFVPSLCPTWLEGFWKKFQFIFFSLNCMRSKFKRVFIADLKIIFRNHRLIFASLILLILIIFLTFYFPVISNIIFKRYGLRLAEYYPLFSITLIGVIPVLIGTRYGMLFCTEQGNLIRTKSTEITIQIRNLLFMRVLSSVIVSFFIIVLSVFLIKPVPAQGWLRTIFSIGLLSFQSPLGFIIFSEGRKTGMLIFSWLSWIFLIAMPLGLLIHHPWNYIAFLSPFYWIAWAWIIRSPTESLVYGVIALSLTFVGAFMFFREFFKTKTS